VPVKKFKLSIKNELKLWKNIALLAVILFISSIWTSGDNNLAEKIETDITHSIISENPFIEDNKRILGQVSDVSSEVFLVDKVIDGDTIRLRNGRVVRYIGIDTPETSQGRECFAEEAAKMNKELVLGKKVRLVRDVSGTDRYGRLLRYVYVSEDESQDEIFVNEYLVRMGYASVMTYPPDITYSSLFVEAERQAREESRGLWGECGKKVEQVDQVDKVDQVINYRDWECSSNTYNCSDFETQIEAQNVFEFCGGLSNDVHRLDSDKDGIVCESLP